MATGYLRKHGCGVAVCAFGLLLFWGSIVYLWVNNRYLLQTPPQRDCSITSLLLDERVFPLGTSAGEIEYPIDRGPIGVGTYQDADRTFAPVAWGGAIHAVYRARTVDRAQYEYRKKKEGKFRTTPNDGPWESPQHFTYHSPIADEYYLACGNWHGRYTCQMVARYEEYYTYLFVPMGSDMTFTDLERVLQAIDARMAECLGKPLPPE